MIPLLSLLYTTVEYHCCISLLFVTAVYHCSISLLHTFAPPSIYIQPYPIVNSAIIILLTIPYLYLLHLLPYQLAEVVKDTIWTLDQIQGIINVNVPVRAVVVKLTGGGLLIYNPVGPTEENVAMIRGLEAKHGPVKHIVLASLGTRPYQ